MVDQAPPAQLGVILSARLIDRDCAKDVTTVIYNFSMLLDVKLFADTGLIGYSLYSTMILNSINLFG